MFPFTPNAYRKRERVLVPILVYGFAICVLRRRGEERGRHKRQGTASRYYFCTCSANVDPVNLQRRMG